MEPRRDYIVLVVASLMLAGCAAYQLEPLTTSHPAHPEAPAVPAPSPSRTLAYTQADIPSAQPVPTVAAAQDTSGQSETHRPRPTEGEASQRVIGEGQVVATVPKSSQIVLDHEEIKGFMEAMTMGYRIDPPSLLEGLKPGDKVRFTIDVPRRAIIEIEKLQ